MTLRCPCSLMGPQGLSSLLLSYSLGWGLMERPLPVAGESVCAGYKDVEFDTDASSSSNHFPQLQSVCPRSRIHENTGPRVQKPGGASRFFKMRSGSRQPGTRSVLECRWPTEPTASLAAPYALGWAPESSSANPAMSGTSDALF